MGVEGCGTHEDMQPGSQLVLQTLAVAHHSQAKAASDLFWLREARVVCRLEDPVGIVQKLSSWVVAFIRRTLRKRLQIGGDASCEESEMGAMLRGLHGSRQRAKVTSLWRSSSAASLHLPERGVRNPKAPSLFLWLHVNTTAFFGGRMYVTNHLEPQGMSTCLKYLRSGMQSL